MIPDLLKKYNSIIDELKEKDSVDAIILFGSYAQGNVKPLSDLDICIITKEKITKEQRIDILSYSNEELDVCIFSELPLSLKFRIITEGKVLYSKIDLSSIKIKTANLWFDFRPILNRLYESRGLPKSEI